VYEEGGDSTDVISQLILPQSLCRLKTPESNKYGTLETGKQTDLRL
jgi:hypothetical protein